MTLENRIRDFITATGTDYKQFRTWLTGSSTGDLSGLTTTAKTSIVAAINEVKASATGAPPSATETQAGVAEVATQAETSAAVSDSLIVTPLKLLQRLTEWAQPLNSNLTSLSGLSGQTTYGRAFLTLVNQAALVALLPTANDTTVGLHRNATQAEVNTGTLDTAAVTPLKFQTRLAAYALPASYLDTDTSLAANSDVKVPSQKAVKAYADGLLDANNAYTYKGGIDASANPNYPAASAGHTYKITVAGRIGGAGGTVVESGDSLTCLVDGSASGTQAAVGANWLVTQTNIDGAVVGPATSTAANLSAFSGTTGKVISDSGVSVETDGTLASNLNSKIPTTMAIRTYLAATFYTKSQMGDPEADLVAAYTAAKA